MKLLKAIVMGASLFMTSGAAAATYATRSAYNAAAGSQTTIDFNAATGTDNISYGTTYTNSGVTFSDTAIYNVGESDLDFYAGSIYGNGYLEWQSGNLVTPSVLDITLPGQSTAVAFDFMELRGGSVPFQVIIGNETFDFMTSGAGSFFGFTSLTPFTSLKLTMPATYGDGPIFPTIDDFSFGQVSGNVAAVPEPSTWAMMLTGFLAAGVSLRRRKRLAAIAANDGRIGALTA